MPEPEKKQEAAKTEDQNPQEPKTPEKSPGEKPPKPSRKERYDKQVKDLRKELKLENPEPTQKEPSKEEKVKKEDPPKENDIEKYKKELEALQKKHEDLIKTFEDRISKTTAQRRKAEEERDAVKKRYTSQTEAEKENLVKKEAKILEQIKKVRREQIRADADDDQDKLDDLLIAEEKLRLDLHSVEREGRALARKSAENEQKKLADANHALWVDSWEKGLKQFGLWNNGDPDWDTPILKETHKLLSKNAKKAKFCLKAPNGMINPEYDNANGAYYAILQAVLNVSEKKDKTKKKETNRKAQDELDRLKAKEQLLSDDVSAPMGDNDVEKLEKLREKAYGSDRDTHIEAMKAYANEVLTRARKNRNK